VDKATLNIPDGPLDPIEDHQIPVIVQICPQIRSFLSQAYYGSHTYDVYVSLVTRDTLGLRVCEDSILISLPSHADDMLIMMEYLIYRPLRGFLAESCLMPQLIK
jgi:hypothetical protein